MLTVITGPMFCGKSERLISLCNANIVAGKFVVAFKPAIDNRYGADCIQTHTGYSLAAIAAQSLEDVEQAIKDIERHSGHIDVVAFDEAQFFPAPQFSSLVDRLLFIAEKEVLVAGLSQDSEGKPFGDMPLLLATADDIIHLKSVCAVTKQIGGASRTFRKVRSDMSQVVVGGTDLYEPRSFREWKKSN